MSCSIVKQVRSPDDCTHVFDVGLRLSVSLKSDRLGDEKTLWMR